VLRCAALCVVRLAIRHNQQPGLLMHCKQHRLAHSCQHVSTPSRPSPQVCHKQYQAAHEMEEHLSSYDHHHRKRLAETRAMLAERT